MSHSKIPDHFKEQFQDTYGHPIQRGNLETPIKNHFQEASQ